MATALAILPVILAGAQFGFRAGLVAGLLSFPLNILLLLLAGQDAVAAMAHPGGIFGHLILVFCGAAIGRLHDLHERVREELIERKRVEERLEESESRFRIFSEEALTGVYLIQDGKFRYVNPALARIFNYTTDELIDKLGPLDLTHPKDRPFVTHNIRRRLEGEVDSIHYTFRGLRKDGS
ncbi:MAG TPA: PAS domain S-box protein, partial [Caldilineae bacterium]|nr:PAS domain S-box protein [Caldilineae bacterium]